MTNVTFKPFQGEIREELLQRRPQAAPILQAAIAQTGLSADELRYLPLTSSKVKEWVALLDAQLDIVGWAPVDGF